MVTLEGCPTVFSEAMGHGLPIIGGTGAGADTAIINGVNGFIVDSKNILDLSNSITKILKNTDLSESMILAGQKKLKQNHDPVKNGLAFQKSISRIINNVHASGYQKAFNLQTENTFFKN